MLLPCRAAGSSQCPCVGGTAWAAEVVRAQGWVSLPAAAKWGFWAWPGSALCTKEEALGGAHRTVFQFVTSLLPLFTSVPCLQ